MAARKRYGNTWWGAEWLRAIEAVDEENRLPRGRSYANAGRVAEIEWSEAGRCVTALVDGSAYYPYEVTLRLPPAGKQVVKRMIDRIALEPELMAALTDGELPPETAGIAAECGIELFPSSWRQMKLSCSCPDSARVCKHIAAVFYVLADKIDADPFLIFALHGIDLREELKGRGADLKAAVAVKPQAGPGILRGAADGIRGEAFPADKEEALRILRSVPYSGVGDLSESVLSLFPETVPIANGADAAAFAKKILARAAKEAEGLVREAALASGEDSGEESPEENGELERVRRFPCWSAFLALAKTKPGDPELAPETAVPFVRLAKNGLDFETGVSAPGKTGRRRFFPVPRELFFQELLRIPAAEARALPPETECWREIAFAAAVILSKTAVIPAAAADPEKPSLAPRIWWLPALRDEGARSAARALAAGISPWAPGLASGLPDEAGPEEAAVFGLAAALSGLMLAAVAGWRALPAPGSLFEAAFECLDLTPLDGRDYGDASVSLARSLRAFSIAESYPWRPVLTARPQAGGSVSLNFGILPRGEDPEKAAEAELSAPEAEKAPKGRPVLLRQILKDPAHEKDRYAVLSVLKTLGRGIPEAEAIRAGKGRPVKIERAELRDFLFDAAPRLTLLGVTLMLPPSLKRLLRPALTAKADAGKSAAGSLLTREALADFSWRVSVGGRELTEAEFADLVARAGEVVQMGEDFVYLDPAEIDRIRKIVEQPPRLSPLEKMRAVLTGEHEGAKVDVSEGLRDAIRAMTEVSAVPPPEGLRATLRPYQERGYSWLMKNLRLGLGSLIADDMGLGKTLQVIAAVLALKNSGELSKRRALAVLPTTLIENWKREIAKFAPSLTVGVYHGPARRLPPADELPDITLTSYGTLRRDFEKLAAVRWRLLIADEAQAIKNPSSAQSEAVRAIRADQAIAMTGTPVENRLSEFWSVMSAVQPRVLGSLRDFEETFAEPIEGKHDPKAAEAFRRLTRPFMIRRLKSDKSVIADLPEKNTMDRFVPMTPEQAALYQATLDRLMKKIEKAEKEAEEADAGADARMARRGAVLQLVTALKQICNSPSQFRKSQAPRPDSGKGEALLELLRECRDAGRKVLVFTQYREMGERLQDWIERATGERPDFLHGGVPAKGRTAMVDRFQEDRTAGVMLISLKAGGTGLNLTAASAVIHYDLWWNPAVEAQATDRAYRIGQRRDVAVYRFITAGTFEETVNEMLQEKRRLAEMTVTSGEGWIGDLPAKELRKLFELR